MRKKAFGYIRVSTEGQAEKGVSLSLQKAKIMAYADLHDFDLVEIVRDEGFSAKSIDGRPGVRMALAAAENGHIDGIIVYKLDRMFRNAQEALGVSEDLKELGVGLHSVTESIDTQSAMGKFFFTIMAACAEMERNLISERTIGALQHKKAQGLVFNHPPYGWNAVDGVLVENEAEQDTIRVIMELRGEGGGYSAIAADLNNMRTPAKRGGQWSAQTVKNVVEAFEERLEAANE